MIAPAKAVLSLVGSARGLPSGASAIPTVVGKRMGYTS